jgi:hypothetical protein
MPITTEQEMTLEVYKVYLDDLGRIGGRHETARAFYLSIISALFVLLSLAGTDAPLVAMQSAVQAIVAIVGFAICILWFAHMRSFAVLYDVKRETLRTAEETFTFKAFRVENADPNMKKRTRLTSIDQAVSMVFAGLFVLLAVLPWATGG